MSAISLFLISPKSPRAARRWISACSSYVWAYLEKFFTRVLLSIAPRCHRLISPGPLHRDDKSRKTSGALHSPGPSAALPARPTIPSSEGGRRIPVSSNYLLLSRDR